MFTLLKYSTEPVCLYEINTSQLCFHPDLVIYFFLVASSFTTRKSMQYLKDGNLCRRHNLTSVTNVYEAAPIALFSENLLSELPEKHFKFPFIFIGKWTMAFLTGQSWNILKSWSWYPGGSPEQGFRCCFTDKLNQSKVSSNSVAQARKMSTLINAITELEAHLPWRISWFFRNLRAGFWRLNLL